MKTPCILIMLALLGVMGDSSGNLKISLNKGGISDHPTLPAGHTDN